MDNISYHQSAYELTWRPSSWRPARRSFRKKGMTVVAVQGEITLNLATCFSVALLAFHSRLEITEYCQASLCMLLGCEQHQGWGSMSKAASHRNTRTWESHLLVPPSLLTHIVGKTCSLAHTRPPNPSPTHSTQRKWRHQRLGLTQACKWVIWRRQMPEIKTNHSTKFISDGSGFWYRHLQREFCPPYKNFCQEKCSYLW